MLNISIKPEGCEIYDAIVVGIWQGGVMSAPAAALDSATDGLVSELLHSGDFKGEVGETCVALAPKSYPHRRIVLTGLGLGAKFDGLAWRQAIVAAVRATPGSRSMGFTCLEWLPELTSEVWAARVFPQAVKEAVFQGVSYKAKKDPAPKLETASLISIDFELQQALDEGIAIADACIWARQLGDTPANLMTPRELSHAVQIAAAEDKFECKVLRAGDIEGERMDALLSVAKGSSELPVFLELHWDGSHGRSAPVVLIGKGITFDAGGISLKPSRGMDEMKYDMCGAASVAAAVRAAARLKLPINVYGLIPACENLPSGSANKPGDVVTAANGLSIEVANTDAEGRLILADALCYADRFTPAAVIDVATLTGACMVALGGAYSGLFANDPVLASSILQAGNEALDPVWQMPVGGQYEEQIKSRVADVCNMATPSTAGACTAATFLTHFVGGWPWAHIDVAGTAWTSGPGHQATGRPTPLLVTWLCDRAAG